MGITMYIVGAYFTAIIIKGLGGLKDIDWSWFILAPLWLALYYFVMFTIKYIALPIISFILITIIALLFYGALSGDWKYVHQWITVW